MGIYKEDNRKKGKFSWGAFGCWIFIFLLLSIGSSMGLGSLIFIYKVFQDDRALNMEGNPILAEGEIISIAEPSVSSPNHLEVKYLTKEGKEVTSSLEGFSNQQFNEWKVGDKIKIYYNPKTTDHVSLKEGHIKIIYLEDITFLIFPFGFFCLFFFLLLAFLDLTIFKNKLGICNHFFSGRKQKKLTRKDLGIEP